MSHSQPASALSREQKVGLWFLTDYETENGIKGTMMYVDSRQEPPLVTLPLNVKGWHKIYVGINYTRSAIGDAIHHTPWSMWGGLRIRLTADGSYTRLAQENPWRKAIGYYDEKMIGEKDAWESIYEVYWKRADLTGQSIVFATPPNGPYAEEAITNVSWIRLVPMTDLEIRQRQKDRPTEETKKLAGCYSLGQLTGHTGATPMYHPTEPTFVTEMIEPFRDSDFKLLLWECNRGDICAYHTKIGRVGWIGEEWNPEWIDPLKVAVDYAHNCGMDLYISQRMVGSSYPYKQSPMQQNEYYYRNRQYAIRDEEGRAASTLSLAYPNIREHWIALLQEAVGYGADGVHLVLNRSYPFVLYEEPVSDSFHEKHGVDPKSLPYEDERWLRHRASYVTQFLREIRKMLDEEERRMGKSLGIAVTFHRKPYPLYYACDVERWAKEGIVNYLMPHFLHLAKDDCPGIVAEYKKMLKGTNAQLWPDIYPRTIPGEVYPAKLKAMYDAGADGFSFWSVELRTQRPSEWAVIRRLGHYSELGRYEREAQTYWKKVPLRELGGVSTHYSHTDG